MLLEVEINEDFCYDLPEAEVEAYKNKLFRFARTGMTRYTTSTITIGEMPKKKTRPRFDEKIEHKLRARHFKGRVRVK